MPEAIKWLLLELGVVLALVPGGVALLQWRRRRATEQALRSLSQQVKQSEAERKRTLTGILTGAHHMAEARSAEIADALIRSERTFFRHCFNTLLSQDKGAIGQLSENLYSVLDDYLRKCAADAEPAAPTEHAATALRDAMDDVFSAAEAALDNAAPIAAPEPPAGVVAPPAPDVEIDWDAAFAELNEKPTPAATESPPEETTQATAPPAAEPDQKAAQDMLDQPLSAAATPDAPTAVPQESTEATMDSSEEDIMAAWGEALEEQTMAPTKKPGAEDAFYLGWDDAFLEETVTIKPDKKPGS